MITTRVLSINPSRPTEGSLHPEALDLPLHITFKAPTVKAPALSRMLLGVSDKTGKNRSFVSLSLRAILSLVTVWAAVTLLTGGALTVMLILAGAIFLSTFGRLSALTLATISIITLPTTIGIALAILAIASAFIGPGKLSLDYLVSRDLRHRARRRVARPEIPFSYRAYRVASQR